MSEVGILICCVTTYWLIELTYKFIIDYKTLKIKEVEIKDKVTCKNEN
jgi:hypothetical protein